MSPSHFQSLFTKFLVVYTGNVAQPFHSLLYHSGPLFQGKPCPPPGWGLVVYLNVKNLG